jgi:hypothetical protein
MCLADLSSAPAKRRMPDMPLRRPLGELRLDHHLRFDPPLTVWLAPSSAARFHLSGIKRRLVDFDPYQLLALAAWLRGALPGVFALPAGIGDVLTGLLALPAAIAVTAGTALAAGRQLSGTSSASPTLLSRSKMALHFCTPASTECNDGPTVRANSLWQQLVRPSPLRAWPDGERVCRSSQTPLRASFKRCGDAPCVPVAAVQWHEELRAARPCNLSWQTVPYPKLTLAPSTSPRASNA